MGKISINDDGLNSLILDVVNGLEGKIEDFQLPSDYKALVKEVSLAANALPPIYHHSFYLPFLNFLLNIGPDGYQDIIERDPSCQGLAGLISDIAHSILQKANNSQDNALDGFQEVVSDLYDGFLSASDRQGIKPPEKGFAAPLVKWGNARLGPYAYPVTALNSFGIRNGIINMPPTNAVVGLAAWAALPHETAHDLMHADIGLRGELSKLVFDKISSSRKKALFAKKKDRLHLAQYWASRIDEIGADILGAVSYTHLTLPTICSV